MLTICCSAFADITNVIATAPSLSLFQRTDRSSSFFTHLSHTRWGLDPELHTCRFVRSRSAYLFTSILAASALFLPNAAALSRRLSTHRDRLTNEIVNKRYRSTEVVLALMVNIPWMTPAKTWAEDQTCNFLALSLTTALDLSLNKVVIPSATIRPAKFWDSTGKADCINVQRALQLEGFPDLSPSSTLGKRLLRTRERVWLALFTLDRGICLARGRPYTVPKGPLIQSCDTWHISDVAEKWDGSLVCAAVLRRDLTGLISSVREACNNSNTAGSSLVKHLKENIDRFFDHWTSIWSAQVNQGDHQLPPYVEILATHTRLSTYCSVVNHPTASPEAKQFFRAAGLKAALNVMRVAVQGESKLKSMPNNTVIMISFAACFALGLSASSSSSNGMPSASDTRSLIAEAAALLQRIGQVTRHRNGASAIFGRHIYRILSRSASTPRNDQQALVPEKHAQQRDPSQPYNIATPHHRLFAPDFATFDMTDDQIIDTINNSNTAQEPFQFDESMVLDWFDWPNVT